MSTSHHHTTGEGQSITKHSGSDSQVHTRSLDQPCLLCSGTVTGHSKHMCAETLKASRCSSPGNVLPSLQPSPSSPPPLPNFYASFKNQHKRQLLHKNLFFSSQLFAPNCLPTHNAAVIDLLPSLFPWGQGLGFIDHYASGAESTTQQIFNTCLLRAGEGEGKKGRRKEKGKKEAVKEKGREEAGRVGGAVPRTV